MVKTKKPSSKKKPKGGIDFKKYKHKLGRKLPPPQNATNHEIKSKAIILPEQSLASDHSGLAVDKGLTLKELLQKTSHHNVKIRKAALAGVAVLLLKYPLELTLHKLAVIEKLHERICDNDKAVREKLYDILRTGIFNHLKETLVTALGDAAGAVILVAAMGDAEGVMILVAALGAVILVVIMVVIIMCTKNAWLVILIVIAICTKKALGDYDTSSLDIFLDELDQTSS